MAQISFIVMLSIFKAKKKQKDTQSFEENKRVEKLKKKPKESRHQVLEALQFEIDHESLENEESVESTEESVESIQPVRV